MKAKEAYLISKDRKVGILTDIKIAALKGRTLIAVDRLSQELIIEFEKMGYKYLKGTSWCPDSLSWGHFYNED